MEAIPKRRDFILYYEYADYLKKWSKEAEQQIKKLKASNSDRQLRIQQLEDQLKQALKK